MKQRDCFESLRESLGMSDLSILPLGWEAKPIEALAETFAGGTPSRGNTSLFGGHIPWVKSTEVNLREITSTSETLTELGFKSSSTKWVNANRPLLALYGATAGVVGWLAVDATTNQAVLAFEPNENIDSRWLYWALTNSTNAIMASVQGSGQPNLSKSIIGRVLIPTPIDPDEQRRIALILDTADAAIAKTEALIAKLKQMKAGLLHDLLTRGIDESSGYSFLQGKVVDKPWRVETLAEKLCFITDYRGKTPPRSKHGVPIVSAEVVLNGRLKPTVKWVTEAVYKEWTTRGFPEPGDVIFTTEAPVGEVAPVPEHTVLLTRRVIALRPTDDVNKRFLYWFLYWLNSIGFWKPRSRGTTVPRILKPDILSISIPVPSENEQESIVSTLDSVETRIENEIVVLKKQKLLKAGLMNDLLTGKKPVFAEAAAAT